MELNQLLPIVFTSFICALLSIKIMEPLAEGFGLVDKPCSRKKHSGHIPLIGGLSIYVAVLVCSSVWLQESRTLQLYLIASTLTVFIGMIDDKYDLSVRVRIFGQVIIASIIVNGAGVNISQLGNLFGWGDIELGVLGILFTYLAVMVLMNAFNMIDGIDGLLGMLSLNTFLAIAILFYLNGQYQNVTFPLIVCVALLPYLAFNMKLLKHKANKIYMGDAGSMFIGLTIIVLLSLGTQEPGAAFHPVTALWIVAVPLMDMLAIIIRRVKKGNSPFKPDRDHLHHILLKAGLSSTQALVTITLISVVFCIIGILGQVNQWPESVMLWAFIFLFIVYSRVLKFVSPKVNKRRVNLKK
ncbi:UDP-N-acetylglucosamine--undecaprenyl-phosphate N-acetylglucosaminephosphotransferase [Thalassotalea sp. LPB0316]|uniref:UDP-N-acetylglucosamine--undecaprenyl-phosphate N-acetylglucosaminephosphotransferase n=1 Tax=Thalassotalea sp. LPB0316 TaxID=2769490 RepID=UPI00186685BD|nr:UDP-N-acetylglucosamine--undecaprenyl-phosphate N-acetylglucosaminephosphotransferase [Thalassotalea sp. LPB0316]QOL24404.1 UDP-N-acetylglucosamine--undecaprenyl-phosphate N-acetylglucosaminephosphotransferase [Thalassotalea sp. LPB0316]